MRVEAFDLVREEIVFAAFGRWDAAGAKVLEVNRSNVSNALVEWVDLAPTLLEAAGLPVPSCLQGRSLFPLLREGGAPHEHRVHVVAGYNDALGSARVATPTHTSMGFDGRYKSVVYHGLDLDEPFDVQADPGEFDDLWGRRDARDLRGELLRRHFDAVMATSLAGIERAGIY